MTVKCEQHVVSSSGTVRGWTDAQRCPRDATKIVVRADGRTENMCGAHAAGAKRHNFPPIAEVRDA